LNLWQPKDNDDEVGENDEEDENDTEYQYDGDLQG